METVYVKGKGYVPGNADATIHSASVSKSSKSDQASKDIYGESALSFILSIIAFLEYLVGAILFFAALVTCQEVKAPTQLLFTISISGLISGALLHAISRLLHNSDVTVRLLAEILKNQKK